MANSYKIKLAFQRRRLRQAIKIYERCNVKVYNMYKTICQSISIFPNNFFFIKPAALTLQQLYNLEEENFLTKSKNCDKIHQNIPRIINMLALKFFLFLRKYNSKS